MMAVLSGNFVFSQGSDVPLNMFIKIVWQLLPPTALSEQIYSPTGRLCRSLNLCAGHTLTAQHERERERKKERKRERDRQSERERERERERREREGEREREKGESVKQFLDIVWYSDSCTARIST